MKRIVQFIGSIKIAVPLLVMIAGVLAWGTIYEARFGTAAVQRFVYHAWWFQTLLAFLALNLAVAAIERYPWKRRHLPFVLAHIGIILILIGGIIGSHFGVEGQLIIPQGQAVHLLETPGNVLVFHQPNPGLHAIIPTQFESQAWVHEPNATMPIVLGSRAIQVTVDRYYPDAISEEEITDRGSEENPAVHLVLEHQEQQDDVWLLSRNQERFGVGWGDAHVLFLEPGTEEQLHQLLGQTNSPMPPRGIVSLKLPGMKQPRDIPVPEELKRVLPIEGTPYHITFQEYFPDFAITDQGLVSRSAQPNNPAVSFTLSGPEGTDAYLLFALHPEFQTVHGFTHPIPAGVRYTHTAHLSFPPNSIGLVRSPAGVLMAVLTDAQTGREVINPVDIGRRYTHASLGYQFHVEAYYPRAMVTQRITNRSNEVHTEAVHLIGHEGTQTAEAWLSLRQTAELALGIEPITVEYRPGQRELPVTIKLLDFRKTDYPGTQMAASFESDVEVSDPQRGIILMRKISMNKPLRYRGYSFYQSSYVESATPTTVLSVRNDPGTPLVYAGFVIVILGVVSMFVFREPSPTVANRPNKKQSRTRSRST